MHLTSCHQPRGQASPVLAGVHRETTQRGLSCLWQSHSVVLLNECHVPTRAPAEITQGVFTLKTSSPLDSAGLGKHSRHRQTPCLPTWSSWTDLPRTQLHALNAPGYEGSLEHDIDFPVSLPSPSPQNTSSACWPRHKYLLHVTSASISQDPPLPGSYRTHTPGL